MFNKKFSLVNTRRKTTMGSPTHSKHDQAHKGSQMDSLSKKIWNQSPTFVEIKIKRKQACYQRWSKQIVNHWITVVTMAIFAFYSLFLDDFRVIFMPISADDIIYGITTVVFGCFIFEMILHQLADSNYLFSFFFWLDLISTISMLFDIGWLTQSFSESQKTYSATSTDLAKTSRTARIARVIRVIRLIRLIRIVKLYKQARLAMQIKKMQETKDIEKKLKSEFLQGQVNETMQTNHNVNGTHFNSNSQENLIPDQTFQSQIFRRSSLLPLFFRKDTKNGVQRIPTIKLQSNLSIHSSPKNKITSRKNTQSLIEEEKSEEEKSDSNSIEEQDEEEEKKDKIQEKELEFDKDHLSPSQFRGRIASVRASQIVPAINIDVVPQINGDKLPLDST